MGVEKFPLKKMDDFEEPLSGSIFTLRPFQTKNISQEKNENFGALRAPTQDRGEEKTGGKVF